MDIIGGISKLVLDLGTEAEDRFTRHINDNRKPKMVFNMRKYLL